MIIWVFSPWKIMKTEAIQKGGLNNLKSHDCPHELKIENTIGVFRENVLWTWLWRVDSAWWAKSCEIASMSLRSNEFAIFSMDSCFCHDASVENFIVSSTNDSECFLFLRNPFQKWRSSPKFFNRRFRHVSDMSHCNIMPSLHSADKLFRELKGKTFVRLSASELAHWFFPLSSLIPGTICLRPGWTRSRSGAERSTQCIEGFKLDGS
jgi:hypothetical protein